MERLARDFSSYSYNYDSNVYNASYLYKVAKQEKTKRNVRERERGKNAGK